MTRRIDECRAAGPCACGSGQVVSESSAVCCDRCWERIGVTLLRLEELDILDEVQTIAGGALSLHVSLSRERYRAASMVRYRVIRAVWDRLRPLRYSRAAVCDLLGVDVVTFQRALKQA
jgi:hypothetical protein